MKLRKLVIAMYVYSDQLLVCVCEFVWLWMPLANWPILLTRPGLPPLNKKLFPVGLKRADWEFILDVF